MKKDSSATQDLKQELFRRIVQKQKGVLLTPRERRALEAWVRSGATSDPVGKAKTAVKKFAREFPEFQEAMASFKGER